MQIFLILLVQLMVLALSVVQGKSGLRTWSVTCGAHRLQNGIRTALMNCAGSILQHLASCRKIATHFHKSALAAEVLDAEQKARGMAIRKVVQDVLTRWNSQFYMVRRLVVLCWASLRIRPIEIWHLA